MKTDDQRKKMLILAMAVTAVFPLVFLRLDEPTFKLNVFKLLAKAGSLCGTMLLIWQCLLGYRVIGGRLVRDFIWVLHVHKTVGQYALLLILLHPVFITLFYVQKHKGNPLTLSVGFPFDLYVFIGMLAFAMFLVVVVTSVFFRAKMDFKPWYGLHITSYPAIGLIFVHSFPIGQTLQDTRLDILWWALLVLVAGLIGYRLLCQVGIGARPHTVGRVKDVGDQAKEIICKPIKAPITPRIGQFVYFRQTRCEAGRPFTVSRCDRTSVCITVKAQGRYSTALQSVQPGQQVLMDGPYGIFTQKPLAGRRPLVMVAGGIGITPFYRLLTETTDPNREMILFYGNRTTDDIIYGDALKEIQQIKVVHVISHQEDYPGEKGFITVELMQKYVRQNLKAYDFLLCGPPVMITKVEQALSDIQIPSGQIHHELFSF